MIARRTFYLGPITEDMLAKVQDYADISADDALEQLVQYGFVAYRMTVMHQLGLDPGDSPALDLPERPHD